VFDFGVAGVGCLEWIDFLGIILRCDPLAVAVLSELLHVLNQVYALRPEFGNGELMASSVVLGVDVVHARL
jgi:hypothetical protein